MKLNIDPRYYNIRWFSKSMDRDSTQLNLSDLRDQKGRWQICIYYSANKPEYLREVKDNGVRRGIRFISLLEKLGNKYLKKHFVLCT